MLYKSHDQMNLTVNHSCMHAAEIYTQLGVRYLSQAAAYRQAREIPLVASQNPIS